MDDKFDKIKDELGKTKDKMQDKLGDASELLSEKASDFKDLLSQKMDDIGSSEFVADAKEKAAQIKAVAGHKLGNMSEAFDNLVEKANDDALKEKEIPTTSHSNALRNMDFSNRQPKEGAEEENFDFATDKDHSSALNDNSSDALDRTVEAVKGFGEELQEKADALNESGMDKLEMSDFAEDISIEDATIIEEETIEKPKESKENDKKNFGDLMDDAKDALFGF